jgi:hypothetical protein
MTTPPIPDRVQALAPDVEIRPIADYDHYYVTADGRVISDHPFFRKKRGPKFLKLTPGGSGYLIAPLTRKYTGAPVHVLVAEAFHGPKPGPEYVVMHLNHNRLDNRAENLQWGTWSENSRATVEAGRRPKPSSPRRFLTPEIVRDIKRRLRAGEKQYRIAADYGFPHQTISSIKTGKAWKHVDPDDEDETEDHNNSDE